MGGLTTGRNRVRALLSEAFNRGRISRAQVNRIQSRAGIVSAEEGAQEAISFTRRAISRARRPRR